MLPIRRTIGVCSGTPSCQLADLYLRGESRLSSGGVLWDREIYLQDHTDGRSVDQPSP